MSPIPNAKGMRCRAGALTRSPDDPPRLTPQVPRGSRLTLALLLRRRGLGAEVIEPVPELREAAAAIACAPDAMQAPAGSSGRLVRE